MAKKPAPQVAPKSFEFAIEELEQILAEMPDLEAADLQAALHYAARQIDYPRLAA